METEFFALMLPAFLAGILTFLAPCTFPLIPGYIAFISGASAEELRDPEKLKQVRKKVFLNGLLYVVGFSLVFIVLGSLFGLVGAAFAEYQLWLTRAGGALVIFFGLYLTGIFKTKAFQGLAREKRFNISSKLTPGKPSSSFLFGAAFAFGWTPCVGPILGSILLIASTSGQVAQGAFLLLIFSAGLAIPFLLVAIGIGSAAKHVKKLSKYLNIISIIGGIFLIIMGLFLLFNRFQLFISYFYQIFDFINYEAILDYL